MVNRKHPKTETNNKEIVSHILCMRRVARTITGRKVLSFSATAIAGAGCPERRISLVTAKSINSADAAQKAIRLSQAPRHLEQLQFIGDTIPYLVKAKYNGTKVTLIPAGPGTGLVACKSIKIIADSVGIKNILSKVHGSHNPINVGRAAIVALKQCKPYSDYANKRNKSLSDLFKYFPNKLDNI